MRITRLASYALASGLLIAGGAIPALAQQAPPTQPAQPAQEQPKDQDKAYKDSDKAKTASGELVKVDTEKKTIAVKMADGAEWSFDYTTTTEISGSNKDEQGLATAQGSKVVVHYTTMDGKKTATKVIVTPAEKK